MEIMIAGAASPIPVYVLVDYENLQALDVEHLKGKFAKLVLLAGVHQKFSATLFAKLTDYGIGCEVIVPPVSGPNALDMILVFQMGRMVERNPKSPIYIVSKDRDYNGVVQHVLKLGGTCKRVVSLAEVSAALAQAEAVFQKTENSEGKVPAKTVPDYTTWTTAQRIERVIERMSNQAINTRPKTKKKLTNALEAIFAKQLDADKLKPVLDSLKGRKFIAVSKDEKVTYPTPPTPELKVV